MTEAGRNNLRSGQTSAMVLSQEGTVSAGVIITIINGLILAGNAVVIRYSYRLQQEIRRNEEFLQSFQREQDRRHLRNNDHG